jgi:hypothetical protein
MLRVVAVGAAAVFQGLRVELLPPPVGRTLRLPIEAAAVVVALTMATLQAASAAQAAAALSLSVTHTRHKRTNWRSYYETAKVIYSN